jgi:hypothetical protein
MIRLYINYYNDKNLDRQKEIITCLNNNMSNNLYDEIHILHNDNELPSVTHPKISQHIIKGRPTFGDFFDLVIPVAKDTDITIFMNSDCYLSEKNLKLIVDNLKEDTVYCMGRWDADKNNKLQPFHKEHSQDAWCFRGVIRRPDTSNFFLGILGCDNRLAWELRNVGYKLINPARDIKLIHLHNSGIRNYKQDQHVPPPYLMMPVSGI